MLGRQLAFINWRSITWRSAARCTVSWCSGFGSGAAALVVLTALLTAGYAPPAEALPSYARQTGQTCGTCHTDFAGLTPYGRLFKIQGYTAGGGAYRSTLFPSSDEATNQKPYAPPISMMAVVGLHQHGDAAPAA